MGATESELAEVVARELALLSSLVRSSTEPLEALLDPTFREIGASGRLWSRSDTLSELLADELDGEDTVEVREMETALLADGVALLTYVSIRSGRRARRSSLWRHHEGAWRIVFHQGTLLS
jgi:hypothetical protein